MIHIKLTEEPMCCKNNLYSLNVVQDHVFYVFVIAALSVLINQHTEAKIVLKCSRCRNFSVTLCIAAILLEFDCRKALSDVSEWSVEYSIVV